jgi:hypothetical protein
MLRKILASAILTGLAVGTVAVPAANATTTTPTPRLLTITAPKVQVYKSGKCADYAYTVQVNVPEGEEWAVIGMTEHTKSEKDADVTTGIGPKPVQAKMRLCPKRDGVGPLLYAAAAVRETAPDADPQLEFAKITMQAPSTTKAVVTPKHVKPTKMVKVNGKVTYRNISWKTKAVKKQWVTVQFQAAGSPTNPWTNVTKVKTKSNGKYSVKVKPTVDGRYRVVYSGEGTKAGSTSAVSYIDVI